MSTPVEVGDVEVIVAMMAPPFMGVPDMWIGNTYEDRTYDEPYEARAKVTVIAAPEDTLGAVIDQAAELFGIRPGPHLVETFGTTVVSEIVGGILFYEEETDRDGWRTAPGSEPGLWPAEIWVPSAAGPVLKPWRTVKMRELIVAADAGALIGDPKRPYLYPGFPQGALIPPELAHAAFEALQALGQSGVHLGQEAASSATEDPWQAVERVGGLQVIYLMVIGWFKWIRGLLRRRPKPPEDSTTARPEDENKRAPGD